MMSDWLNKILAADDDGSNYTKLVPLIIFFVIWVFSAISKAVQKGKKGTEEEPAHGEEKHQPGFDELAKKIRERYAEAQKEANRGDQQGKNAQFQPPARPVVSQTVPVSPRPAMTPPQSYQAASKPMFEVTRTPEGPTLKVVKELEKPLVNIPVTVERPTLQKVEPAIEKVEGITSDVPMVSTKTEIPHLEHPYLAELSAQYATRDGFRKAILNYEILGPPLAFREQGYHSN
jgi:hypothetical protein